MKVLAAVLMAIALLFGAAPAQAAQDPRSLPPTCDYQRWWTAEVCGDYQWTVSIKQECLQMDRAVALKDPLCRGYVFDWRDGNLTKKYWVQNCQKQRLGLKGKELAKWRHWCHTIKPKK